VLALVVASGGTSLPQRFGVFEGAGADVRVPPRDLLGLCEDRVRIFAEIHGTRRILKA
jgi:hypothetical protein